MLDDGVIDFEFEEVGVLIEGAEVGMFSGTASIDQDGAVVGLTLDSYVTDKTDPLGIPKRVSRYIRVPLPARLDSWCTFTEQLARGLATTIQKGFEPEINDKLNDWSVSIAEQTFEPIGNVFDDIRAEVRALETQAEV